MYSLTISQFSPKITLHRVQPVKQAPRVLPVREGRKEMKESEDYPVLPDLRALRWVANQILQMAVSGHKLSF